MVDMGENTLPSRLRGAKTMPRVPLACLSFGNSGSLQLARVALRGPANVQKAEGLCDVLDTYREAFQLPWGNQVKTGCGT